MEGGAIPSVTCVRQLLHLAVLKAQLAYQSVSIIADETTDISILNMIARIFCVISW